MGFGISDEVLEKILAEPWTACGSGYYAPSKYTPSYTPPRRSIYTPSSTPTTPVVTPLANPSKAKSKESDKNISLLSAIYNHIKGLYADREAFWSDEYKNIVSQVHEYFNNIIEVHSIATVYTTNADNKKAQSYLFDGFSESIFYYLTHNTLTKPKLRSIVEDTLRLVRKWNMFEIDEGAISKQVFFNYYINRYGLSKNEYHCCPHCGSDIIQGLYNCPNCYAQTDIVPIRKPRNVIEAVTPDSTNITQIDDTTSRLQIKLRESDEEIKRVLEANEDLQRENERLRAEIEGKDNAIKAMRDHIADNDTVRAECKKVLIIGDIPMNVQEVFDLSAQIGIDPDMLDILDDFSKIKKVAGRIKNDDRYAGIIIGAVPHKVSKLGDASSLSALFRGNGFPFLVEARTYQGELKITRESLRRALNDMWGHLLSMNLI